ncbi:MAG: 3-deoxy-D-manno-octulosonic acid transferase [Phycisphaerae bacterium]|jgi:3-deoxy-D-manno-octulosonic-acid transferase
MRFVADLLYLLFGLLYLPVALYQAVVLGKNRTGWGERFGSVAVRDPERERLWIHAVSLGEVNATPRLVEGLREALPETDLVFSTTTDTGYARAVQLYGYENVFRFPLDFSLVIGRVLRRVRPTMVVLIELEVWYNLGLMAARRGIPVVVANGRLTARSASRLGRVGFAARRMFGDLAWVGAQDEAIAERFRDLGTRPDRIGVTSSLKWDSAHVAERIDGADALARAMGIDASRPLWVCGSTGPGEEEIVLAAYRRLLSHWSGLAQGVQVESASESAPPSPVLAIVPRKPERFDEVARLIDRSGFSCIRRSACSDGQARSLDAPCVLLIDTMGELRKAYSLADAVFVGRSLVPLGGSDPIEVAALGKAVVVGPHTDNFAVPVAAFRDADALREVHSADELADAIGAILHDKRGANEMGERARRVVLSHQGATKRTVERIVGVLRTSAHGTRTEPYRK